MNILRLFAFSLIIISSLRGMNVTDQDFENVLTAIRSHTYDVEGNLLDEGVEKDFDAIAAIVYFVNLGGNINQQNEYGSTMLILACKLGYKDIVEFLLSLDGIDKELKDNSDTTALMYSCHKGDFGIVQLLVENGALISVDWKNDDAWKIACEERELGKLTKAELDRIRDIFKKRQANK